MDFNAKRILGYYFKNMRMSRNLTLDDISFSLPIRVSKSCINEFENGKSNTSLETIIHLFDGMNLNFSFDPRFELERKKVIDELVELYCRNDLVGFSNKLNQIEENICYRDSLCYPIYLLADFNKCVFDTRCETTKGIINKIIADIDNISEMMTEQENLLWAILKYRYLAKNDEGTAYEYLTKVYENNKNHTSALVSVIEYLLAYSEHILGNYHKEAVLLENAAKVFSQNGYIERMMYSWMDLAMTYNELSQYERAKSYIAKALRISEQISSPARFAIVNNYGIICNNAGDYNAAIYYAEQLIKSETHKMSAYSMLVTSNVMLKQYEAAKCALSKLEELNELHNNPYYALQIKVKRALLYEKKGSHYYSALKNYMKYARKNLTVSRCIRILDQMISYCNENQLYEEINIHQNELLSYYKKLKN